MALDLLDTVLRRKPEYVLLDAAQEAEVLTFLSQNKTDWRSLFEGQSAYRLAAHAPYISTVLHSESWVRDLLQKCWGRGCLIFVSSSLPIEDVRKHFRQFLYVQNSNGEQLYFRFYDPRILRVFLPTCNAAELKEFFGPVAEFILEGEKAVEVNVFTVEKAQLENRSAAVSLAALKKSRPPQVAEE